VSNRILIVDDDRTSIELLTMQLADVSEEIRGLTDSSEVVSAFMELKPDLMLLDLHMPPPDGLEVLWLLRDARTEMGYVPVIVLTADSSRMARNSALILGADDFLTKPFDRWEVVLRARNLLRTRRLYTELQQQ